MVLLGARHPGVAEAAGAAQEPVVGDPELPHRGGEFADAVVAEAALTVRGEMREVRRDDLALLAEGARHQGDVCPLGRVPGHGGAVVDRLVVGVRVHQEQTAGGKVLHGTTLRAGRTTGRTPAVPGRPARTRQNLIPPIMPATFDVTSEMVGAIDELAM